METPFSYYVTGTPEFKTVVDGQEMLLIGFKEEYKWPEQEIGVRSFIEIFGDGHTTYNSQDETSLFPFK